MNTNDKMSDWQPIETAPKDRHILVWTGERQCVAWWVTHIESGGDEWCLAMGPDGDCLLMTKHPTLWRDLPDDPPA